MHTSQNPTGAQRPLDELRRRAVEELRRRQLEDLRRGAPMVREDPEASSRAAEPAHAQHVAR